MLDIRDRIYSLYPKWHPFKVVQISPKSFYVAPESYLFLGIGIESQVEIANLGKEIKLKEGDLAYLEIKFDSSLKVTGCLVTGGGVGLMANQELNYTGWVSYPDVFEIEPKDIYDKKGKLIKKSRNKKLLRAFVPLAYPVSEGLSSNGDFYQISNNYSYDMNQVVFNHMVLMHFCRSGVPVAYPFPFFNFPIKLPEPFQSNY